MRWDLFCRVIDNHGDVGVCWRLAADLAARGEQVRLWLDDGNALQWMAPGGAPGVEVLPWPVGPARDALDPPWPVDAVGPGDVVIEAFGCALPCAFVRRMAAMECAPVWINLEYLSAEAYVERAHRLPSPQRSGSGAALRKWFFYPGFTPATGGLIRETDLLTRQQDFDAPAWLLRHGAQRKADERIVSLFCYEQPALPGLIAALSQQPTLLLATFGQATGQVREQLGDSMRHGALRAVALPALTQLGYDELLWASDLNCVRGEDSFVRAQWAGKPFLWQAYPQRDGVHFDKLDAFLNRFLQDVGAELADGVRRVQRVWNGAAAGEIALPSLDAWSAASRPWRERLLAQPDLVRQLIRFVVEAR